MPFDAEADKHVLVEQLVVLAAEQSEAAKPSPGFIRAFYRNVAAEDLLPRAPADLLAAAGSLWQFTQTRRPGRAAIRLLPRAGWAGGRTVIEIVNDDMPFLVDSVTAALGQASVTIHSLIHPILPVTRDGHGQLLSLEGDSHESVMQIELADPLDESRGAAVTKALAAVLQDVRTIVIDWRAMRDQAHRMAENLTAGNLPLSVAEVIETASFLNWLADNNFTFLGYRDYALEADNLSIVPGTGRGLLRDENFILFEELHGMRHLPADVLQFMESSRFMMISKAKRRSTVHRPVPFDTIAIKRFDKEGATIGLQLLAGLFTSASHVQPPRSIPVLRHKVARCLARAGFAEDSHDEKALQHILDTYPRDELFQIEEDELATTALGILHLQQRPRVALFVRRDAFGRFASCLLFVPRERYSEAVRGVCCTILAEAFGGSIGGETTHFDDVTSLARLHVTIESAPDQPLPVIDVEPVEQRLVEATRTWSDRLADALHKAHGVIEGSALMRRYGAALPVNYTERFRPLSAVADIAQIEKVLQGTALALALYHDRVDGQLMLKTFHASGPIPLSDVLPILENLGLRVINEIPYEVLPQAAAAVVVQEFEVRPRDGGAVDLAQVGAKFEAALPLVWSGAIESDGFNRLVLGAGLGPRQTMIPRAYCKIIRQAGSNFSQAYMEDALASHPAFARLLVALFEARFDPATADRAARSAELEQDIAAALDQVANLDEDRILRSFLDLVRQTLRTNYYQRDADGAAKPYLAVKLASQTIELLPRPRPLVEIYLYSPRVEGCHLRGDKVARGGIRWSDRKEDFRTEILGLMKAQVVKNAVIVPGGSKGGFVVKRPPTGREALMAEVVACYKLLMSALLDLTDTIDGDRVVPPADTVRHDGDDPYLVVAADKGTATFSDIANGVAKEYGFWLGDAFASGGSVGYDHKAMGITARGAWEAVKRHFRELGTDIQTTDFTCIGVGDMSGDVFGNGMLLSHHIKLVAAFDHRHIFIDPDPDPAASWTERQRLFQLPRSSWADYDKAVLSAGGGIYERSAKAIVLSAEAQRRFGLSAQPLSAPELIHRLLVEPVDLLWFGGIGTYVKATGESNADAGDRTNDALRVDAASLKAKVVGEGANLAMTQRGRIEFALKGGRLNTDAIDNSAGVDTSDHEVNIKIAVGAMLASGRLEAGERNAFLAAMTDEVGALVLEDNYLQTAALSVAEAQSALLLDQHVRLMRTLERAGRLDRAIEFLPDDEALAQRAAAKRGLVRPELAVLLAYAKNALNEDLVAADLPDDPAFETDLLAYFPAQMRMLAPADLKKHRLRREIIATSLANQLVNRVGPAFVVELQAKTGRSAADVARAFRIGSELFDLPALWQRIEAEDAVVPAAVQIRLLIDITAVAERVTRWLLQSQMSLDVQDCVASFRPGVAALAAALPGILPDAERLGFEARLRLFTDAGAPAGLSKDVVALANLAAALDIIRLDQVSGIDVLEVGRLYYQTGERFGLDRLRDAARAMPATSSWQRLAASAVLDDFYFIQSEIARRALDAGGTPPTLDRWIATRPEAVGRIDEMVAEISRAATPDLAMLTVVARQLRALI